MGFRSVIITEDYGYSWPAWLRDKYPSLNVPERGLISSRYEIKIYDDKLMRDIQEACIEAGALLPFRIVIFHECAGITLCDITKDGIEYLEPDGFKRVKFITHYYCTGCSKTDKGNDNEAV